ncbi:MAG TPA: DEAD/DEAH box helicase family protein [Candidatus Paceibacterota bacterium]|nr:DEAD/DEAH box helicase family protein [Candidatus Paceibacterota bacterium]HRU35746.1 DEAD/DEAH box helicase family protein [Candidatus Paceibacterota bacterium]
MQLKIYQENAIDELLTKAKRLLGYSGSKKLVFKSPTGSGKTIMMAEFLKQLVDDREVRQSLGFIWTAPRQLHIQSREKLENYFETSRALKCSYFEDLDDRKISENEILFFNWESINRADNVYIRDNEQDFNLSKVLERTKEDGREIILIIDEAHHHATTEISHGLIQMIGPKLTIEVTATPATITDEDEKVFVQLDDVKKEGMIKKAVILNDDFDNFLTQGKIQTQKLSGGSEELVIDAAMKKRQELVKEFQKEGVNVNPLVLIQLPDRKTSLEDRIRERVESILKNKYKISTEKGNNKLAIWLSGEHVNKENVERQDSEVEVLIFKQAIALGWDCPRAQILVLFRQWHSPIFSIQTVGRIMRMPEPDKGHYGNEILNYGYVYTNLDNIEIQEDIAKDYITIYTSKRSFDPKLSLLSCYPKRHREKTRLSPLFIEIFLKQAKEYNLKKQIDIKAKKFDLKIISDYKAEDVDALAGAKIIGDKEIKASGFDMQKLFDFFVRNNLTPFYPEDRSVGRVKESIYKFFEQELKMWYGDVWEEIVQIVLSDKNSQHFVNVINKAKEKYQMEVVKRESEMVDVENWNIPESLPYGREYSEVSVKKSIMQPFFSDGKWKPETAFIDFLEKSEKVEWWFKNGDRDATFFAVRYNNGEEKPFYVDFIVKLKDGRIGLFDTKAGFTKQIAGPKIDGLYKYIQNENKKGKNLFGGIVTNTERNYRGRWVYFDKTSKELKNDFSNWKDLEL